jgi:Flp pilus assembly protein TadG
MPLSRLRREEQGQSAVEFALVLPMILILMLGLLQLGVMVRDQIMVLGAAREGVRQAIVTPDRGVIEQAAARAAPGLRLAVEVVRGTSRGEPARVTVKTSPAKLPLVGQMVGGLTLKGSATMRIERSD